MAALGEKSEINPLAILASLKVCNIFPSISLKEKGNEKKPPKFGESVFGVVSFE